MTTPTRSPSALDTSTLQASLHGELIGANNAKARAIHNGMIDKKPALVASCKRRS
jgi:hypothetical protein